MNTDSGKLTRTIDLKLTQELIQIIYFSVYFAITMVSNQKIIIMKSNVMNTELVG